jgi:hypothetical protein
MADFSDYYENQIINHMLRGQAFTPPTTVYVALFTSSTGLEANTGVTGEATGTGYARKAVTLSEATTGATANSAEVNFGTAGASWGTITHAALVDHETNTTWGTNVNVLAWKVVDSKVVASGDIVKIAASALTFTVA